MPTQTAHTYTILPIKSTDKTFRENHLVYFIEMHYSNSQVDVDCPASSRIQVLPTPAGGINWL